MCVPATFILIKNLTQHIILETLFLSLIELFMVTSKGIVTKFEDGDIVFQFITTPQTKELNEMKEHLIFKEKDINYVRNDVQLLNISSQINSPKVKFNIDQISKRII